LIYDAAHAFGVSCHGRPIGCWGDVSIFSFHATKLFHTAEGGAVAGQDAQHFSRIASLRNFGILNEDEVRGVGVNGKLTELQAAMGLAVLPDVDEEIRLRGALAARYQEGLAGVAGLRLQRLTAETVYNHAYFTVEIDAAAFGLSRDALHLALRAERIISRKYFSPLCSDNEAYRHLPSARPALLPNAQRLATRILCLPLYGDLTASDVDKIVSVVLATQAAAPALRALLE